MMENQEQSIKVDVKLDEVDIFRFSYSTLWRNTANLYVFVLMIITVPLLVWALLIGAELQVYQYIPFFLLLYFICQPFLLKKQARDVLKGNKLLQKVQHFNLSSIGVEIESDTGKLMIKWSDFVKVLETKHDFQLFVSKQQAHIVPKRFFTSNDDIDKLREILRAKVLPKMLRLKKSSGQVADIT